MVDRQFEPEATLFRAPLDVASGIHQLWLDERLANRHPARREKRVRHRAADEERVDAGYQVLDDLELVRHLCAAEDGDERPLGTLEHAAEVLYFLRHQQTGGYLRDVMNDPFGGGVGAVSRAEGIVDVHVSERGELAGELGVVFLFFRMEAQVFEQNDTTRTGFLDGSTRRLTDGVLGKNNGSAEQFRQAIGHRLQRVLGIGLSLRSPEMGRQNEGFRPLLQRALDGRQ